jgi:hypothetical protein
MVVVFGSLRDDLSPMRDSRPFPLTSAHSNHPRKNIYTPRDPHALFLIRDLLGPTRRDDEYFTLYALCG